MGLRFGENILYYMVVTFSITYLDHIGVNTTRILTLLFFAHILHVLIIPLVGFLTDRIGRKPVYILGAVTTMIWPFLAFPMFNIQSTEMILAAIMLGLAFHGLRSEEHTSALQSLMRISYAVFCLKKKQLKSHDEKV